MRVVDAVDEAAREGGERADVAVAPACNIATPPRVEHGRSGTEVAPPTALAGLADATKVCLYDSDLLPTLDFDLMYILR